MGAGTRAMDRLGRGVSLSETQGPEDTLGCAAPWSPSGCRRPKLPRAELQPARSMGSVQRG